MGHFADFFITCNGFTFAVHKAILLIKGGPWFLKAVCSGFRESLESTLDLPDDEPEIIARLLLHIYTGKYYEELPFSENSGLSKIVDTLMGADSASYGAPEPDDEPRKNKLFVDRCMIHAKVFAVASKYEILPLADKARRAFLAEMYWRHNCYCMQDLSCKKNLNTFLEVLELIYETPLNSPLKDIVTQYCSMEKSECTRCKWGASFLIDTMRRIPDFAVDMATCFITSKKDEWFCKKCCGGVDVLIRPCDCGKMTAACQEPKCVEKDRKATQCRQCGERGNLAPPR